MAKLLVVDNSQGIRNMIKSALEPLGHSVYQAKNGKEGCRIAKNTVPDLVIMDYHLPDINGFKAGCEIKKSSPSSNIQIVVMSREGDEKLMMEGLSSCADDYITKPFGARFLVSRITDMLENAKRRKKHEK
ncbi:MAG: response regulator [bacterium]